MGEASPPSCEQASAFCWLFLCNQNKFLRDESQGFKGVQRDVKQASSVNQRHTLRRGCTLAGRPVLPTDTRQGKGLDGRCQGGSHEPNTHVWHLQTQDAAGVYISPVKTVMVSGWSWSASLQLLSRLKH